MAASSLKLRIDAQGNLGIGTSAPLHKLHVANGNLNVDAGNSYRINNFVTINSTALGNTVVSSGLQTLGNLSAMNVSGNVSVQGNNLIINSVTNRVGLGTTTPAYTLDIVGDVYAKTYRQNNNVVWDTSYSATKTFDAFSGGNYFPENTADTTSITGLSSGVGSAGSWRPTARSTAFPMVPRAS